MVKRKNDGSLAVLAYVRGWRQANDGRWFKRGVVGMFNSASDAFEAEERSQRVCMTQGEPVDHGFGSI